MIGRILVPVGCLLGFIALVSPHLGEPELAGFGGAPEHVGSGEPGSASNAASAWNSGEHTLTRQTDGHFYTEATVEGTSLNMLVDTGASVVALTASDAAAIGLEWNESEMTVIGTGASGPVTGVRTRLDEVEIGGITQHDVDAVIIPDGLGISLLGQSWLSQVDTVEIAGDRMLLSAR